MSVITGKNGFVVGKNCVRQWTISHMQDLQPYICSATEGMEAVVDGNNDWSGSYQAHGPVPDVIPGEAFTFEGVISGTRGAAGNVGASGPAIVDSVEISFNYETGEIVGHTVNFSANGALSFSAIDSTGDAEVLGLPLSAAGLTVEFFDLDPVPAKDSAMDLGWRSAVLTITSNNPSFVDTTIPGETQRAAGNLSAMLALQCYESSFANLPALNTIREARVYTNTGKTTYWNLKYVRIKETTDLAVNIETADLIGATINAQFSGLEVTDPGGTPTPALGRLVHEDPAGDTPVWRT